jgi:hypothetical protein
LVSVVNEFIALNSTVVTGAVVGEIGNSRNDAIASPVASKWTNTMPKTRFLRAYGHSVWTEVTGGSGRIMVKIIPTVNPVVIADKMG